MMGKLLRSSDVVLEKLHFISPSNDGDEKQWAYDIPYIIGIGNRNITSYISDWSNDVDFIRYQLESYCYNGKATIEFKFEDAPTVINLERVSTIASVERIGDGIAIKYDDYMKVVIKPNSFVKGASVIGFCDEKATVKELYEGLLNIGRQGYAYNEEDRDNSWDYEAIVLYNHIKSPIIERYLTDCREDENTISIRQKIIHHIVTITPDYGNVLGGIDGDCVGVDIDGDDRITICNKDLDKEICVVTIPGIYVWYKEFESKSDGVNSTMGCIDVEEWHRKGLALAKELKDKLPDDFDVWYGYPFEDIEQRYKRPILIY